MGVLRSVARRRAESRFWGVFIIAVHRAFVLGSGARGIAVLWSCQGMETCVTVFAFFTYLLLVYGAPDRGPHWHSQPHGDTCQANYTRAGESGAGENRP